MAYFPSSQYAYGFYEPTMASQPFPYFYYPTPVSNSSASSAMTDSSFSYRRRAPRPPRGQAWDFSNVPNFEDVKGKRREALKYHVKVTPRIDIVHIEGDDGQIDGIHTLAPGICAALLVSFSRKAHRLFACAGWRNHEARSLEVSHYSETTFHIMIGRFNRSCNSDYPQKVATGRLGPIEYLQLWRAAQELDVPVLIEQLHRQAKSDLERYDFDDTMHLWHEIYPETPDDRALLDAVVERLDKFAAGKVMDFPLPTFRELAIAVYIAGRESWTREAVVYYYKHNRQLFNPIHSLLLDGMCPEMIALIELIKSKKRLEKQKKYRHAMRPRSKTI